MSTWQSEALAVGDNSGDITPQNIQSGTDYSEISRTQPIAHGATVAFTIDDWDGEECGLYQWLRSVYYELDGEETPAGCDGHATIPVDPDFLPNNNEYVLVFDSSGWKAGDTDEHGDPRRWYKYHLTLRRVDRTEDGGRELTQPPVSVSLTVSPRRPGLVYSDGNSYTYPHGDGSRITVQTTYIESGTAAVKRSVWAVGAFSRHLRDHHEHERPESHLSVDSGTLAGRLRPDSALVSKLEAYVRFDIDRKYDVRLAMQDSEDLVDVGGGAEIDAREKRIKEGWQHSHVETNRWWRLGFEDREYARHLKLYHANDWTNRGRDDFFRHPKLEASLGSGSTVPLDEWDSALRSLRRLVVSHLEWAGVRESDLVGDDFFQPSRLPTNQYDHPDGRIDDLKRFYSRFRQELYSECYNHSTLAVYDILSVLVENYGATYDHLVSETGFSRSNIQYHVGKLSEVNILTTVGNPAIVCFNVPKFADVAEELLHSEISHHFDETTLSARRIGREERAEERRERRENGEAPGQYDRDDREESDPSDSDPSTDVSDSSTSDGSGDSEPFVYLSEWDGTLLDLEHEIELPDHPRDERDVRVRKLEPPE